MKVKFDRAVSLVFCLFVLAAVAVGGCAKKPAPEEGMAGGETTAVTQMPSEEVKGVPESSMQESGVRESGAMQGAEMQTQMLQRIYFEFDQYTLTPEAQRTLTKNATYLQSNPGIKVRIEGHCDERGSDEYNLALGERRAAATKSYLVTLGVAAGRLTIISYGEEKPLDMGHNEEAWAMNRRAEFVVAK